MRTTLLCLIAIAALSNWWSRLPGERRGARAVEIVSKPATTVLVGLLALTADAPQAQITIALVAIGLCLLGDVALLGSESMFLVGLASFALAHIAFIVLFADYGLPRRALAGVALLIGAVVAASLGRVIVLSARAKEPRLGPPVVFYLAVILIMAAVGWATGRIWVLVGTTAFVVSDSILGWNTFVRAGRWYPLAVMMTYHVAIVSLALSL